MPYIPPETVSKAREMDLLTYLRNYEPDELVHFGGSTYCTREHDSLIIGIVIVSIGILALILNMWIKQRTHETGILLSIGVGKVQIVAQYILETLMIAIIALGLSYFTSGAIAQGTSNLLFAQAAQNQPEVEIELPDDGTEYLDITGQYIPYDTSNMVTPDNVEVHVTPANLLLVCLLEIIICIVAVVLASLPAMKMQPKNVLSQMC